MAKQWYVLHTYSGHENKVKTNIEKKMNQEGLNQYVLQVTIPSETVAEIRDGKRYNTLRKIFPGYVMLEMDIPEAEKGSETELAIREIYQKIRDIPGVTGFLGTATKPVALRPEEVENIMSQASGAQKKPKAKQTFTIGEKIKVIEGPFANFYGSVTDFSVEKGKLTVEISIFGRPTPLELDVFQVERE